MNRGMKRILCTLSVLFFGVTYAAETQPTSHAWNFRDLGLTPIQSGGRVKPLDTFAREIVLFETGTRSFQKWQPLDLMLSWIANPEAWRETPLIRVGREDVRRQLGLDEKRQYFSPQELIRNTILLQYAEKMGSPAEKMAEPPGTPRTSPREQELKSVIERITLFHNMVTGQSWVLIPRPLPQAWASVIEDEPHGEQIRHHFAELVRAYQDGNSAAFEKASQELRASVEKQVPQFEQELRGKVLAESVFNRARPFLYAWIFYLLAAVAWIGSYARKGSWLNRVAGVFLGLAFASHVGGMILRSYIAGRPPVTNMYESVVWVSFGVLVFALILYVIQRQSLILVVASVLACFGLVAADVSPAVLDPSINPLVPVLRSNYWLTIHVLTITLGYAAFALTLGLANITLFQFYKKESARKINDLNQLTYRAMQFGVVLIAAGTILGGIWADYSWGRFWGWDPKEVWALITLLAYLVILHGRFTGWVGQFGFAAWSAVSFMTVVMAWYGVNFILGAGLHSYGFASGGTPWVIGFVGVQLLYVAAIAWDRTRKKGKHA